MPKGDAILDYVQVGWSFVPKECFKALGTEGGQFDEDVSALRRIENKLNRLLREGRADSTETEYMSIKRAVKITGLSDSHIRRAILSGDLPASNTGGSLRPVYSIARKDLTAWMERKKGGTSRVPPPSTLKELINRHLPDL